VRRPELVIAEDAGRFARAAAEVISQELLAAIERRGRCSVALAGGRTPAAVYEELALRHLAKRIPLGGLHAYFSDERCVPPDDPASNYRMVYESLLQNGTLVPGGIHRIEAERPDLDRVAAEYETLLPVRPDVLLLGMGADGHTASLFPGSPILEETDRRVAPSRGGAPDLWRITITPRVIGESRSVVVLVSGPEKAGMVARALQGPWDPKRIPVQLAWGGRWVLDREAARDLNHAVR